MFLDELTKLGFEERFYVDTWLPRIGETLRLVVPGPESRFTTAFTVA